MKLPTPAELGISNWPGWDAASKSERQAALRILVEIHHYKDRESMAILGARTKNQIANCRNDARPLIRNESVPETPDEPVHQQPYNPLAEMRAKLGPPPKLSKSEIREHEELFGYRE